MLTDFTQRREMATHGVSGTFINNGALKTPVHIQVRSMVLQYIISTNIIRTIISIGKAHTKQTTISAKERNFETCTTMHVQPFGILQ